MSRRASALTRDPRRRYRTLERDFFGAVGADGPSQLELLVAPWAEFTELRLAVRAEHVLGVDRLATAGAGPQFARRAPGGGRGGLGGPGPGPVGRGRRGPFG